METEFYTKFQAKQFATIKSKLISIPEDEDIKWGKLDEFIKKFQDPKEVDKL